ncbi:Trafficking protein particle complex subunit BET5 [Malassezia vespertilionis]|uniref:Trafficking protein particle complex subunit n=1 Tax=Malassezia vespertilionis TaxID=2020962 RepID=A0A2N1JAX1_9BASI|nr:Trafficking protein particle complex subunit BET5 [Malassezia vespertilionis]PKI83700.1 Bet5p [Malassezia vespertilionis]WFD07273.1 Trafficking protein particle complex subunit BET5 [Malassezia vespertilionis]
MAQRVYSLWIFDRHCQVIYHQDWSQLHAQVAGASAAASAASFTSSLGATLQRAAGGASSEARTEGKHGAAALRFPGETLPDVSRHVASQDTAPENIESAALPFDEEAKLLYGLVYSLRNMVRKLGGKNESFYSFSTSTYTLSHLQTPTMYTFVMITDPPPARSDAGKALATNLAGLNPIPGTMGMTLRGVMHELWCGPWVKYAASHPIVDCTEREAAAGAYARN